MVTLCKGQGGTGADNPKREWCNSWKITEQAAYSDLILTKVALFEGPTLFDDYTSVGFRCSNNTLRSAWVDHWAAHSDTANLGSSDLVELTIP